MTEKMHYFKAVQGRACPRYGSDTFIGCRRGPKGYVWNLDAVVAITDRELAPNRKAYSSHVRLGDLARATKTDYDKFLGARKKQGEEIKAKRDAEHAKAKKDAAKAKKDAAKKAADEQAEAELAEEAAKKAQAETEQAKADAAAEPKTDSSDGDEGDGA